MHAYDALAFDLDTAKNTSLFTVAGAVLLALAAVWLVKQVVTKVLTVVVLLVIAGLVWSQRAELTDCADDVRANWTAAVVVVDATTCTFFGQDVKVPSRTTILGPDGSVVTTTTVG